MQKAGIIMDDTTVKTYRLKNLDCAHCASKIEKAINEMEEVEEAVLVFTSKKFHIKAHHNDLLSEKILKKCTDIEPDVELVEEKNDNISEKESEENEKSELLLIIIGAVFLGAAMITENLNTIASLVLYIFSYIILGGKVLKSSIKSIKQGRIFNENFLMSLATLAAFFLKDYPEAVGVMLFFRIGEFFEDTAVEKSRKSIMSAVDMRPQTVSLSEGDRVIEIPAEHAVPGQIIIVKAGDRIPLDGVVEEGQSSIDTSSVTGEHLPENVNPGDKVISGCINLNGLLKIKVEKALSESMVTRIVNSIENAAAGKPKLDRFITRFANIYTPVVVIAAILTAVIPSLITKEWHKWIYTAVTFLVISCPCAIVLSVPLTFFSGIGAGSKKGILFKSGSSMETVRGIRTVILDKTGTVTTGKFTLKSVEIYGDYKEDEIIRFSASCEQFSTHPVAECIKESAVNHGVSLIKPEKVNEIAGMGIETVLSGKTVLCGNEKLMKLKNIDISSCSETSGTVVLCAVDGMLAGCLKISDTIKPDSAETISKLKSRRINTVMLTGDSKTSAAETAKETGIDSFYSKLLPEDKHTIMKEIREKSGAVMFVGDGINDAPVLAGADVSAAMGTGAEAAIDAADIVFMNSDMDSLWKAFVISEDTNRIAKQNIIFALVFKLAVMILGIAGFANMWFAVFADSGVAVLCIINSIRILKKKY